MSMNCQFRDTVHQARGCVLLFLGSEGGGDAQKQARVERDPSAFSLIDL